MYLCISLCRWVATMGDKKNLKKLEDAGKASRGETK